MNNGSPILYRRRQFLLGPAGAGVGPDWPRRSVDAGRLTLTSHPDLLVTQVVDREVELTLLGFMLDPQHPAWSDSEILRAIAPNSTNDTDLFQDLSLMGGRWALIIVRATDRFLVHDACGLRQVVFAARPDGVWCASEPGFLASELSLQIDPAAQRFMKSLYARSYRESYFPGSATPFSEVKRLLPNHRLDLFTGEVRRYWPTTPVRRRSIDFAANQAATMLRGVVAAAAKRSQLALALTGGIDSRAVLAAAREFAPDLFVYTLVGDSITGSAGDARIARAVVDRQRIAHHTIDCSSAADADFVRVCRASSAASHDQWTRVAFGLSRSYPQNRLALTGSCSEIGRRGFRRIERVTPRGLAQLENMVASGEARTWIAEWLEDVGSTQEETGYQTVDLLYWESRLGSWLAAAHLELDIVQETLAPFNCRAILETLLSVDTRDRDPPRSLLHRRIVQRLWPGLMANAFNSAGPATKIRLRVTKGLNAFLRTTGTYDVAKAAQLAFRVWVRGGVRKMTVGDPPSTHEGASPSSVAQLARAGWGIGDQVLSSATNFLLGVLVARTSTPEEFGVFALVYWTYLVFLVASRALGSQPLVVTVSHVDRQRWAAATSDSVGLAFVLGLGGGLVVALAGLLMGSIGPSAVVLGIGLAGLLMQDAYRFALVADGHARSAFWSDLTWVLVMGSLVGAAVTAGIELGTPSIVALWVVGGCGGAIVAMVISHVMPRPSRGRRWLMQQRSLVPGFLVGSLVETLTLTIRQFILAGVTGFAVVGAIRAGQLVLSPVTVLYQGISLVAGPEASRLRRESLRSLVRWLARLSLVLSATAALTGAIAVLLPNEVGRALLGQNWDAARPVILPLAVATVFTVGATGGGMGLLVLGAATRLARLTVWTKLLGSILVLGGAVAGAEVDGPLGAAVGAAVGSAIESGIYAAAHWRAFLSAIVLAGSLTEPPPSGEALIEIDERAVGD